MRSADRYNQTIFSSPGEDMRLFEDLSSLALDLRWSWDHSADELWRRLDPELWDMSHSPWVVLQAVSQDQLKAALADPAFRSHLDQLVQIQRSMVYTPTWFQQTQDQEALNAVAYFSMEFMLNNALPIYSGGLGNVAGDQLKAASDLGVPVIGIGLLYQQGYFRQVIDREGSQMAVYPYNDPGQLPITPLRCPTGEWLRFRLDVPGFPVWVRAWQVQVGRVRLLLLDSNDMANGPVYRGITSELYGGTTELRLMQEIVLGIGGWRLLEALDIQPEVCHLNEGHAAFAVLERARCFMEATGQPFDVALAATRAGNLFTTHTAVAAGFDLFPVPLIEHYLAPYAEQQLHISFYDLMALGRCRAADATEPFNMAYLAVHGSGAVNGVSRLHAEVSRSIMSSLFPRWPTVEVPVGYVTNGIHVPSWDSPAADALWTEMCGPNRWLGVTDTLDQNIQTIPLERLHRFRTESRRRLVKYIRDRLSLQLAASGAAAEIVAMASRIFNPEALTLCFARRFALYKRPTLLLHDPDRLKRILTNPDCPVQLIVAGKAHPLDLPGQALIRQWVQFVRRPDIRPHAMFISDYDMLLTEQLVQGVDVWINNPRRPWEASGTSGMKILANGGLNLSELDGWWAEAYDPAIGWALGDGLEHDNDPAVDDAEAQALYDLLENEIIPEFYRRDEQGVPQSWTTRIRTSMARLTPQFSTNRSVREYTELHYLPAAAAYRRRSADHGAEAARIVAWCKNLDQAWPKLHLDNVRCETVANEHQFTVRLFLYELDPDSVCLELFADPAGSTGKVRLAMERISQPSGAWGETAYRAIVPAERPIGDFTIRLIPRHESVAIPLEASHILWQR